MRHSDRRKACPHFLVLWRPNGLTTSRLGVTVTRRVANAVGRNHVKRRVREAFRWARTWLPTGVDILVVAKPGSSGLSGRGVAGELSGAFDALRRDFGLPSVCAWPAPWSGSTS